MSELLPVKTFHLLRRYHLQTQITKRGLQKGSRISKTFGSSLDFSDFREYHPGDDLRQIDWNVYARTKKHFIKRFLDEQELYVTIYLDCSKSMGLDKNKWKMAKMLVATLAYTGLSSNDRISIIPISRNTSPFLHKKGLVFTNEMLSYIDKLEPSEGEACFEQLPSFWQQQKSLSFLISDCLENVDVIINQLNLFQANKQLRLIQLLSESEVQPTFQGDLKLIDVERNDAVQVSFNRDVIRRYKKRLDHHNKLLEDHCIQRGISFLQIHSNIHLEEIISYQLLKKGWIR